MYDVVIIGGGVSGASSARELSRYKLNICVVEKEEDVCCGTSKANSAIIHSGIDAKPGTLMSQLNVRGCEMMEPLSKELDFPYRRNGSLIVCFEEENLPKLHKLFEQAKENGVPNVKIVYKEELQRMEPNLSKEAVAAIFTPTAGIVCPFGLNIAMAENAATNGVEFKFNTEVKNIEKTDYGYVLHSNNGDLETKCIVNAAGVYADIFHNMVSNNKIHITPRRGEYCIMDKDCGNIVNSTIFQLPTEMGKGVLVAPTVHGNLLIGPTAEDIDDKDDTSTTSKGIDNVKKYALKSVPSINMRKVITTYSGSRAHEDGHEFIIEELSDAPGFVDCSGIESPGIASSPAIGVRVAEIVSSILKPQKNKNFEGSRMGILNPRNLSIDDYNKLIKEKPSYGTIVCRCQGVTEGEIIDAINRPLGAKSLDGIKRRTTAGMGRCQAGFCSPRTMEILSRELNVSQTEITKSGGESKMIVGYSRSNIKEDVNEIL